MRGGIKKCPVGETGQIDEKQLKTMKGHIRRTHIAKHKGRMSQTDDKRMMDL